MKESKKLNTWRCTECGHEVTKTGSPMPIYWDDGHVCYSFEKVDDYGPDDIGRRAPTDSFWKN